MAIHHKPTILQVDRAEQNINTLKSQIQQMSSVNSGQSDLLSQVKEEIAKLHGKYNQLFIERDQLKSQLDSLRGKPEITKLVGHLVKTDQISL